ncbi:recombination and repair protein RecT [Streptomyces longwoodensis]|uniref:Recombination and repair protein RecT n=1 Tax=Streptomyces longwoodensis TaxID=68231 RepID=A0A101QXG9_9ACTN|nr:recombinase RecT [Streptomyces longwoodensis]KUN37757.1 recombination and repair protein RecT [Streptomyces longwoodensis]
MSLTTLKERVQQRAAAASSDGIPPGQADEDTPAGRDHDAEQFRADIAAALPAHVSVDRFLAVLRPVLPGLRKCTPASVRQAVITAARFGLLPDGEEAVITADDGIATFLATYHGYIELMWRSGMVKSIVAKVVYDGDEWDYVPTAPVGQDFTHRPKLGSPKDRTPLFAYTFAWLDGGARSDVAIVTVEEAEAIRDEFSKAYQRAEANGQKNSLWHTRFPDMLLKTAIRRAAKLLPKSAELRALVAVERAADEGHTQILAALTPEALALEAEARAAARAAEASQDVPPPRLPVKRGRARPRRRHRDKNKATRR